MDIEEIVLIALRWLIPFLCVSLVSVIGSYHGKNKAMRDGLQNLLRAELLRNYEKYSERGFCPVYARDQVTSIYNSYHALGGNGTCTKFYNDIMELPTEPKPRPKSKKGN